MVNEERDLSHRQFHVTALTSQIRKAFKIGLRSGEHDQSEAELLTIYRLLVKRLYKINPEHILTMYDEIRPKVEHHYRERNRIFNRSVR